jgi:diguanylate cyclase (GGDEF)-like protein
VTELGPASLTQIIAKHPWPSLRDALLLSGFMTFAVLLARRYDIFSLIESLADPQRVISGPEAVVLVALFAACIYIFVARRFSEERCDEAYQIRLESEMRELRELAMQDPLTRLPNRRALLAALEAATSGCGPNCAKHAFFLLDLNGFKRVNDLYGHAVGDHVLQVVVERFRRVARPSDLLARLGGDEFAVLSYDVDRKAALKIGSRFAAALRNAIASDGYTHDLGVAIGAALCPDDGATSEAILRKADLAMYRAKESEGSALAFFDPAVDTLESARKKAIG